MSEGVYKILGEWQLTMWLNDSKSKRLRTTKSVEASQSTGRFPGVVSLLRSSESPWIRFVEQHVFKKVCLGEIGPGACISLS
jgi:hypothetical protein